MSRLDNIWDFPLLPEKAFRKALFKNSPVTLEGGKGGSAPAAPDPYTVANATTQTNQQTAAYNKALNLNNYSNPFGSQTSTITGYDESTGAPIYSTSIAANPQLQGLLNSQLSSLGNAPGQYASLGNQYGQIGNQFGQIANNLGNLNASDAMKTGADNYYQQATAYLDPQFSQQQASLESQLANQGLTPGSQAYNNAMDSFNRQKTFAYNQAQNSAQTQGQQLGLNQLNAQASLYGQQGAMLGNQANTLGSQAGLLGNQYSNLGSIAGLIPGYSGTSTVSTSPANIGQNIYSNYQGALNNYNASTASSNQAMGGLFGLGSAAMMGMMMSDARVKTDIKKIGTYKGHNLYSYRYIFNQDPQIGVMAQELPEHAVEKVCGVLVVNYGAL